MASKRTAVPAPDKPAGSSALDALTGGTQSSTTPITDVALELIDPHPDNPRRDLGDLTELAASIRAHGVRQNLLLVPHPDTPGRYRAVIGHRRSAAAALAGLSVVPASIDASLDPAAQLQLMLIENLQRSDLTAVEEADGYQGLLDLGVSEGSIAERTGRSRTTVRNRLRLVSLPEKVRAAVHDGQSTIEDALAIADLPADEQKVIAKKVGTSGFGYAVAEARTRAQRRQNAAPLLELLAAAGATELSADEYSTPDGLIFVHDLSVTNYPEQVPAFIEKHGDEITSGWAWRWAHAWLRLYRPLTLEEATARAERDEREAVWEAERQERAAAERAAKELLAQFAGVTADLRREFLEHLVHDRKSLTRDQTAAVFEYCATSLLENPFAGQYFNGTFRSYPVPTRTDQADALVGWLRIELPEDHRETYHRTELAPLVERAAARLSAPQRALAACAAALEPLDVGTWRVAGRSTTVRRWYQLLEELGYQVSDEERSALVVPADEPDDEPDDEPADDDIDGSDVS